MSDIHTKLAEIAGQVGPINKTERNEQQGFMFRSIEQMTGGIRPLFASAGISIAPRLLRWDSNEVTSAKGAKGYRTIVEMEYTFTAGSDDSHIVVSMPGEAVDYGDKSTSKACQMAFKYALTEVLLIGSGDADPDTHSPDVGRRQRRAPQNVDPATGEVFDSAAYAREQVAAFQSWSDKERQDNYKALAKALIGGKATTKEEIDQVVKALAEEYYDTFPDEAPFVEIEGQEALDV